MKSYAPYRFLYYTDTHYREKPPRSRRDAFGDTILAKLRWINELGVARQVNAFFDGGDFFDRHRQSVEEILKVADVLQERAAPTYAVIGNHPILGDYETWRPHMGHTILSQFPGPNGGPLIRVLGPKEGDVSVNPLFTVRMDHDQLVKDPITLEGWKHTVWADYDAKGANMVLCSDYHPYQGHEVVNGVHFVAPGALSRGALSEEDLTRPPRVALVTIRGTEAEVEFLVVPHAPAEEVFNVHSVVPANPYVKDDVGLDAYIESMKILGDQGSVRAPEDVVRQMAVEKQTPDPVLDFTLDLLKEQD